jgi:hypothetical protein
MHFVVLCPRRNGKGLTVPTQLISVGYYERCYQMQQQGVPLPNRPRYTLVELELENPPEKVCSASIFHPFGRCVYTAGLGTRVPTGF